MKIKMPKLIKLFTGWIIKFITNVIFLLALMTKSLSMTLTSSAEIERCSKIIVKTDANQLVQCFRVNILM